MQNKSPLTIGLVLIVIAILALLSRASPEPNVLGAKTPEIHKSNSPETSANYGKLPLYFVENQGRLDPFVKYYVPGGGKNVYFAPSGVVYELFARPSRSETPRLQPASYSDDQASPRAARDRWAVKLGFVGAKALSRNK